MAYNVNCRMPRVVKCIIHKSYHLVCHNIILYVVLLDILYSELDIYKKYSSVHFGNR